MSIKSLVDVLTRTPEPSPDGARFEVCYEVDRAWTVANSAQEIAGDDDFAPYISNEVREHLRDGEYSLLCAKLALKRGDVDD